ncbi:MAG: response regulator [Gemmatimonadaceae bacterium]|nr:response regulator [Gemmatimonadaceae bacterium]
MNRGRILIADDETTFRTSTAELLRREGYEVETAVDANEALAAIATQPFDLLITDLEMPGNADLNLVREVARAAGGLPIIIITGFPSVRSSVACIELPVAAYLVKPIDLAGLLSRVSAAVTRFRTYQSMQRAESRLREYREEFSAIAAPVSRDVKGGVDSFLALTLRNVMGSLTDLEQLGRALANPGASPPHACQLINCPRGMQLQQAVEDTIEVLEETKGAFKSKALGDLRKRLELLVKHV